MGNFSCFTVVSWQYKIRRNKKLIKTSRIKSTVQQLCDIALLPGTLCAYLYPVSRSSPQLLPSQTSAPITPHSPSVSGTSPTFFWTRILLHSGTNPLLLFLTILSSASDSVSVCRPWRFSQPLHHLSASLRYGSSAHSYITWYNKTHLPLTCDTGILTPIITLESI